MVQSFPICGLQLPIEKSRDKIENSPLLIMSIQYDETIQALVSMWISDAL